MLTIGKIFLRVCFRTLLVFLVLVLFFITGTAAHNNSTRYIKANQRLLAEKNTALLQLHLALDELSRLRTASPDFAEQHQDLIAAIEQFTKTTPKPISHSFLSRTDPGINNLIQEHSQLYDQQSAWLKQLIAFNTTAKDIFIYNPHTDLAPNQGLSNPMIALRAQSAAQGLAATKVKLQPHSTFRLDPILASLDQSQNSLRQLSGAATAEINTNDALTNVYDQINTLKITTHMAELTFLQSETGQSFRDQRAKLLSRYQAQHP
jgi:hypothetical protein